MTNPPTGPTPSQDPNAHEQGGAGAQPVSGSQQAQPSSGAFPAQPSSGAFPAQPAGAPEYGGGSDYAQQGDYSQPQYGQPQYGQPQYGQPQYGAPQYGAPQYGAGQGYAEPQYGAPQYAAGQYGAPQYGGGYPAAPQAYGQAGPSGRRPGSATAAAVLGFIFGTIGFFTAAYMLVALTGAAEGGLFGFLDGENTFALVLVFISTILWLVASVLVFVGAVQLIGGKSSKGVVIATIMYIVAQLIALIAVLIVGGGDGIATLIVSFIISILIAGVLLFLAKSSDVEKWIARKSAARAAGYEL